MRPKMELQEVSLTFRTPQGDVDALRDISIEVEEGEFVTIVGPSGCGKSTLLNLIANLIDPDQAVIHGTIHIDRGTGDKSLGYVFQKDTLLPWRSLLENVAVGLEIRGVSRAERWARARELIRLVGLDGFQDALPHHLSGGMRQRASIARSLAYDPDVILMDEPFGALDAQTRMILQQWLLNLWAKTRKTILFVTHDLGEAVALGSRVVLMTPRPGRIREIYPVRIPYPRAILRLAAREDFVEVYQRIWQVLSHEIEEVMGHDE